eukprot:m.5663 g.5663  ORF g.5663 m.5663 type:complete len:98 (-) comp4291_c0_seq2:46-339(-)
MLRHIHTCSTTTLQQLALDEHDKPQFSPNDVKRWTPHHVYLWAHYHVGISNDNAHKLTRLGISGGDLRDVCTNARNLEQLGLGAAVSYWLAISAVII